MVAWWRRKVVPRARRAWAAVAARLRARKPGQSPCPFPPLASPSSLGQTTRSAAECSSAGDRKR